MPTFKKKKTKSLSPARTLVIGFLAIIAVGSLLLFLPVSSRSGEFTDLLSCFFTATSATCVTGITIFDTYTHWSIFGQSVIILLIQVGGIGFITFVTFFNLMIGRKLGLIKAHDAAEEFAMSGLKQVRRLFGQLVIYSFAIELLGALLFMPAFVPKYSGYGVFMSFFTAISSFCNAGFDLMGIEGEGVGFINYVNDPLVMLTLTVLIVLGGLGFVVWQDIASCRKRHLALHTKVVLVTTGILLLIGTLVYVTVELTTPELFGDYSAGTVIMTSLLGSASARTAGVSSAPLACANELAQLFTVLLMFIGTAPGSTGGGIKVTTLAILVATTWSVIKNRGETEIMKHTVSKQVVYKTVTVVFLSLVFALTGFLAIYLSDTSLAANDVLFEVISAFSTTGFTSGVTEKAGMFPRIVLIITMFVGRVGPISLLISLTNNKAPDKSRILPESDIMVG